MMQTSSFYLSLSCMRRRLPILQGYYITFHTLKCKTYTSASDKVLAEFTQLV